MIIQTMLTYTLMVAMSFTLAVTDHLVPVDVEVDKTEHDFGVIAQGVPQTAIFKITNLSARPMLLKKVKGSCGCTATGYDREPIEPGAETEISATYNAERVGIFSKTVTVYTNLDDQPLILTIKGNVTVQ